MGYAMFAARKVMLTNQINMLGLEQMQITNERMKLTKAATAISDGEISAADYASLQGFGLAADLDLATQKATSIFDPNYQGGLWTAATTARKNTGLSWGANATGAAVGAVAGSTVGRRVGATVGSIFGLPGAVVGGIAGTILGGIVGNQCSAKTQARNQQVQNFKNDYNDQKLLDYNVEKLQAKIAEMENELDMRQQKLDTELQVYNNELEQVKNAEKQGIKNATPNYAGQ